MFRKLMLNIPPRYQFCEIPNNKDGWKFVNQLKEYANTERYKVRVRGQHLKKGENWRQYSSGQPISKSTHLRIYFDDQWSNL